MLYWISACFFLFGIWITAANWGGIYCWFRYKKHTSSIPLLGGLSLFISLLLIVKPPYKILSVIPFVIDYGSLPLLIHTIWFLIKNKDQMRK